MHELSLAIDLVDRAVEVIKKQGPVLPIRISVLIGPESGVDSEAFAFAFPEAARGSLLESVQLEIIPGSGREFSFQSLEVKDV